MAKYETKFLQDPREFEDFLKLIRLHGVRSYLEIGSKNGGSLWRVATKAMSPKSKVVSVDLPFGDRSFKESVPHLEACIEELKHLGYESHLFLADSTDEKTVQAVRALSPFDLCLIDANHTEPYVRKDWANYGPMAKMVAFHDIGWIARPPDENSKKLPIEVPKVWGELKRQFKHVEIKYCARDNGIGVLWPSQPL